MTFLVDENLLGLARKLRMLGFDCKVLLKTPDKVIAQTAREEGRYVLTKDRRFYEGHRGQVELFYVQATLIPDQVREVLLNFQLENKIKPMIRCLDCNSLIQAIDKAAVKDRVEAKTWNLYERFYECPTCRKVFWEGSHFNRMSKHIDDFLT